MATAKKQFEVLEAFALKSGDEMFEVGAVIELTPAQAKKFAANVKEIDEKLSPDKEADEEIDEDIGGDRLKNDAEGENKVQVEITDYLMQYQFKNVNNIPTVGGPNTNPSPGSKAERMKAYLLAQPKVRMFIPRPQGEDQTILQSVNLNGYRLDLPKQTYLEVPQQVAEVLMESLQQTEKALAQFTVLGDKDKESAL